MRAWLELPKKQGLAGRAGGTQLRVNTRDGAHSTSLAGCLWVLGGLWWWRRTKPQLSLLLQLLLLLLLLGRRRRRRHAPGAALRRHGRAARGRTALLRVRARRRHGGLWCVAMTITCRCHITT